MAILRAVVVKYGENIPNMEIELSFLKLGYKKRMYFKYGTKIFDKVTQQRIE